MSDGGGSGNCSCEWSPRPRADMWLQSPARTTLWWSAAVCNTHTHTHTHTHTCTHVYTWHHDIIEQWTLTSVSRMDKQSTCSCINHPQIVKQDTLTRQSLPPAERLQVVTVIQHTVQSVCSPGDYKAVWSTWLKVNVAAAAGRTRLTSQQPVMRMTVSRGRCQCSKTSRHSYCARNAVDYYQQQNDQQASSLTYR